MAGQAERGTRAAIRRLGSIFETNDVQVARGHEAAVRNEFRTVIFHVSMDAAAMSRLNASACNVALLQCLVLEGERRMIVLEWMLPEKLFHRLLEKLLFPQ